MRRARLLACVLLALPAGGRADAYEEESRRLAGLAFEQMLAGQARILGVADRIRIAGAPLCGDEVGPVLGLYAIDERSFRSLFEWERDLEAIMVEAGRDGGWLDKRPKILLVEPGLAGDRGGARPGDVVTRLDGKKPGRRRNLEALKPRSAPLRLEVERGGESVEIELPVEPGCRFESRYWWGTEVNAFAMRWGRLTGMYVIGGMLAFLPGDDDLAIVLGHELAHLILNHSGFVTTRNTEADADYLGLYLAARAGFDVERAPALWDRMAAANPYSGVDRGFYSHPAGAERSLALRSTLEEIARKRAAGEPLEPERERARPGDAVDDHMRALRGEALQELRAKQQQVVRVHYKLQKAAVERCGDDTAPVLGAGIGRRRDFLRGHEEEVEEAFGAVGEVRVFVLAEGSPADRAGLRADDQILEVDGRQVEKTQEVYDALRASEAGDPRIVISRDGERSTLRLPREPGCHHGVIVIAWGRPDTFAHRNKQEMYVPTGLVSFARNDDELALGIAHQMAHHVLDTTLNIDAGDEPPADRLALYMAAAAGFDVDLAPAFWDRLAAREPHRILSEVGDGRRGRRYHVGMPARAVTLRATVAEIREKVANEQALLP